MDIFFVVATIAVAGIGVLVALALVRILRILRNVEKISNTVSEEAQLIKGDIDSMRMQIRTEGFKFAHLARFARASLKRFIVTKVNKK